MTSTIDHTKKLVGSLLIAVCFLIPTPAQAFDEAALKQIKSMGSVLSVMEQFFDIIDSVHAIADNPEKSTIYHMHKIKEIHEDLGNKANAVPAIRGVLKDSDNPTIRRAAYLMLGETLKETGSPQEALKVLEQGLKESIEKAR
jgi:HEAT repeat protein